jgi:hypothetical protein
MSRWAMYGRRQRCKRNLTFSEAFRQEYSGTLYHFAMIAFRS